MINYSLQKKIMNISYWLRLGQYNITDYFITIGWLILGVKQQHNRFHKNCRPTPWDIFSVDLYNYFSSFIHAPDMTPKKKKQLHGRQPVQASQAIIRRAMTCRLYRDTSPGIWGSILHACCAQLHGHICSNNQPKSRGCFVLFFIFYFCFCLFRFGLVLFVCFLFCFGFYFFFGGGLFW